MASAAARLEQACEAVTKQLDPVNTLMQKIEMLQTEMAREEDRFAPSRSTGTEAAHHVEATRRTVDQLNAGVRDVVKVARRETRRKSQPPGENPHLGIRTGAARDAAPRSAEDIRRRVRSYVRRSGLEPEAVFQSFDVDRDGTISKEELHRAFGYMNVPVTASQVRVCSI